MNQQEVENLSEEDEPKHLEEGGLVEFLKKFEMIPSHEEKLREAITFMRTSLAAPKAPYFKGFWEVRKLSLPLFKEEISSTIRTQLWEEYIALTREGRRLKNLLDEESAFAAEQIEIAIQSLEVEVDGFHRYAEEVLTKAPDIEMPLSKTLEEKRNYYLNLQQKLGLLNTYASHIHALRKELIKTEIRLRHKNKFFERLSAVGDRIFPLRKELIKEVSGSFTQDVHSFVEKNFSLASHENIRRHVFFFREEIKALQACAKIITLNTNAFTTTREELSKCWDQLKGMEKEIKKEYTHQKQKSSENVVETQNKISEVMGSFKEGKLSPDETIKRLDGISRWMREIELTHYDVKLLKEELRVARAAPQAKLEEEESAKKQKEIEIEEKRKELFEQFKCKLEKAREKIAQGIIDEEEFLSLKSNLAELSVPKREKSVAERALKELRDLIEEKKETTLLNLSDDDKATLDHLKEIIQQRKARRAEVKVQMEEYRRLIGGSSLDFEKAMELNELMRQEKERLEKLDEGIAEIEEKINQMKKKKN